MNKVSQNKGQFNLIKNIIKIRLIDTKQLTMKIQIY